HLKLLGETPLADDFGVISQTLEAKGESDLTLKLTLPLEKGKFHADGKLSFKDSTLIMRKSQIPINHINGALLFDDNGISAKAIKANILDEKVRVDIAPQERSNATLISASGAISGKRLDEQFPNMGFKQLQGRSTWSLEFEVPSLLQNKGKLSAQVTASSDLVGTSIDQPPPIGKSKKQSKVIRLATSLSDEPIRHLQIGYAGVFSSELFFSTDKQGALTLERGAVILGNGKVQAPKDKVLLLSGGLGQLDLSPWLKDAQTEKLSLPPIRGENLQFGKLKFDNTTLNNINLSFTENSQSIKLKVKSDLLDGRIQIPLPYLSKPINADLERLSLQLDPDQLSATPQKKPAADDKSDPRSLPGITLASKMTQINGHNLGPLTVSATRIPEGLNIEQLNISSKLVNMTARGRWVAKGKKTQSSVRFRLETDSLGKLLAILGFAPNLKQAPAEIEADLIWSGNPRQFSDTDVSGTMEMHIGKGRFLEVDPGLGRVFGLLNISALQRRLTMDFSDTFKKGFSFDKAEGTFELDRGDAYTNDLRLESPSALIEITGRTGLVSQDFDQLATVTPSISTTIPLAGALAGGPAVGAALLIIQKIVGKQVDKVSTTKYTITGSWDNPNIEELNQDTEGNSPTDKNQPPEKSGIQAIEGKQ
ncbi:MAG: AsmA-like C-terminal region-containing protein, partial [Gammaproteobacteria bacterium]